MFNYKTLLLWLGPVAFLLIGLVTIFLYARGKAKASVPPLDSQQQRQLDDILQKGDID